MISIDSSQRDAIVLILLNRSLQWICEGSCIINTSGDTSQLSCCNASVRDNFIIKNYITRVSRCNGYILKCFITNSTCNTNCSRIRVCILGSKSCCLKITLNTFNIYGIQGRVHTMVLMINLDVQSIFCKSCKFKITDLNITTSNSNHCCDSCAWTNVLQWFSNVSFKFTLNVINDQFIDASYITKRQLKISS